MLIAGLDLDIQDQAQAGHPVGVERVRRPARLVRVIADHCSFLVAEQRLDRGIHVQNPRNPQQRQGRLVEMAAQPDLRVGLRHLLQGTAHRVFADHPLHPQQARVDAIPAHRRDVSVAPVASQDRQHHRSQHVALHRRIRAGIVQGTGCHPAVEQAALLQKFNEKGQLAQRRYRRCRLPFHMDPSGKGIQNNRRSRRLAFRLLTQRVSQRHQLIPAHAQS